MVEHIDDAKRFGVAVLPPNVNSSEALFSVADGKIVFGLTAIKGFGRGAADEIVRSRTEGGPFKDLFDFCDRLDPRVANKNAIEKLIMAGALDCLGGHRAQLLHALPRAIQAATERQNDRRLGQRNLFDAFAGDETNGEEPTHDALPDVPAWSEAEKLKNEKEVLDFYMSSHPLAQSEKEIKRYATHSAEEVKQAPAGKEVTVGGMLMQLRYKNTKKARNGNSRYLLCMMEDFSGSFKCVMWPDDLLKFKDEVREDTPLFVKGTVDRNQAEPTIVITRIFSLEQAQRELAKGLHLLLKLDEGGPRDIDTIAYLLKQAPGNCPVVLTIRDAARRDCVLRLGREFHINPSKFPRDELENLLGLGNVKLT
jgi:DNA polymerase-3 subunit alpha